MDPQVTIKLEAHRLKCLKEQGKISLLMCEDLTPEELEFVTRAALVRVGNSVEAERGKILADTLAEWGIMCPHPLRFRLYGGKVLEHPSVVHRWYECGCCTASVKNEYYRQENPSVDRKVGKGS